MERSVHKAHVCEERCLQRNRVEGVGLIKEGIRLGLRAAVRLDRSTVVGFGGRSITGVSGGFRCCVVRVATGGGEQRKDGDQKRNDETVMVPEHGPTLAIIEGSFSHRGRVDRRGSWFRPSGGSPAR